MKEDVFPNPDIFDLYLGDHSKGRVPIRGQKMLILRKVSLYNLFGVSSLPTSKNSSTPFAEAPSPLKENLPPSPVLKSFLGLGSIGIKKFIIMHKTITS